MRKFLLRYKRKLRLNARKIAGQFILILFIAVLYFFLSPPLNWAVLSWYIFFQLILRLKKRAVSIAIFNIGVMICVFSATDLYLKNKTQKTKNKTMVIGQLYKTIPNTIYGYGLIPNSQRSVKKVFDQKVVYNVTYTTDKNSLRISPPFTPSGDNNTAILFFGGSFQYGEGVMDEETIPYVTGLLTKGRYAVYNFAVHGFGPQQMLAGIENSVVEKVVAYRPAYAIYIAICDHVKRAAGHYIWLNDGPKYILINNNEIIYAGTFNNPIYKPNEKPVMRNMLSDQSEIISRLNKYYNSEEEKEVALFTGIVYKSRSLLMEKYPGLEFHVIVWNELSCANSEIIAKSLSNRGISVHHINDILPGYKESPKKYMLLHEEHPNSEADKIVAEYIVKQIVEF